VTDTRTDATKHNTIFEKHNIAGVQSVVIKMMIRITAAAAAAATTTV